MSLAARMTRCPRPHDPDRGAEARAAFSDLASEVTELIAGAAGCSPYLDTLLSHEGDWLRGALEAPELALAETIADFGDDLGAGLRAAKRRVALLAGLMDLGGVWSLEEVTAALTRLADAAVDAALRAEVGREIARGRLEDQGDDHGGAVALAMGKMGAFELNYSSDIDLIVLFDEDRYGDGHREARSSLVKAVRRMCALLSERTGGGYVFRTDLRLRPDPSVTPVCVGMDAAERYYESLGRTWERAAHVKARPCAGDVAGGARYLKRLTPFVWRRHLDFAAIQDAYDIRLRIRDHKGLGGPITLEGHDLKLGRGGIREIEFFTQTRQIIAGGRDARLRVRGTCEGLVRLAEAGWVERDVARSLQEDYRVFREVEHRVQMIDDRQTHELPDDDEGFARLAAMMDRDVADLRRDLTERLERVCAQAETFFNPQGSGAAAPDLTERQEDMVARWRGYPALRSERAQEIFARIRPALLERLLSGPRPDVALAHFDGFLAGLPAGVQIFSLFEANPDLLQLIADIAGTTPELAQYLSRNAGVLDAVLAGDFFAPWPGRETLEQELTARLERVEDYERQLDEARRWAREWHFRVGVHLLRGLISGAEAGVQYADLAHAAVSGLWPAVVAEFATRHGPPPGRGAMVLGMGSLGAGHLTAASDLDLIVIYDEDGVEASSGPKPLPSRTYYARLTQGLVTALSAPTGAGRLYEVDMRLRPSGKQGPVATSLASYARYQREEAWTWEHLALTRASAVAGHDGVRAAVDAVRQDVLDADVDGAAARRDVAEMRDRLLKARPGGTWDPKAGRGRMQDIELCASLLALLAGTRATGTTAQIEAGRTANLIGDAEAADLVENYHLFARLRDVARLLSSEGLDTGALGAAGEACLLRETGRESLTDLEAAMALASERAGGIIDAITGGTNAADG